MMENYNLSWNGFSSTIMSFWAENLNRGVFCDTTIVCRGKQYAVHRLILSLGSKYFHDILEKTPCSQPLIIIDDIEITHLEGILQFLYTGEAIIQKNMLPQFLKTAKSLQIKGLDTTPKTNPEVPQKKYMSRNITSQLLDKNDHCDFYGFPKKNYCFEDSSALLMLKQKLDDLKDIEPNETSILKHSSNKTFEGNADVNGSTYKMLKKRILSEKQTGRYLFSHSSKDISLKHSISKEIICPLQPKLNFGERLNIRSTTQEKENLFLSLTNNISPSKSNPFVPIKRLKDSVLKAAFNGHYPNLSIKNVFSLKDMKFAYGYNSLDSARSQVRSCQENHKGIEVTVFDMDGIVQSSMNIGSIDQDVNKFEIKESSCNPNVGFSLRQMKQCAYCPFRNKSLSAMKKHLISHGSGSISSEESHCLPGNLKLFKCSICSFTAQSKRTISKHKFEVHPRLKRYSCQFCSFQSRLLSTMKNHKLLHGNRNVFNRDTSNDSSFNSNKVFLPKNIKGIQQISSRKLRHITVNKTNWDSNVSTFCHAPKLSRCKYCDFTSTNSLAVSKHESICDGHPILESDSQSITFKCQYCSYSTTSESALQGHESYHAKDEEPFKCKFCSYKSAIQTIVKCHELTHEI